MAPRRLANIAGGLLFALAFPPVLLSLAAAAVASDAFALYGAMGVLPLVQSALLLVKTPTRRLFIGSTFLGGLLVLVSLAALVGSHDSIPGGLAILVDGTLASVAVFASVLGGREVS
jgi:hypothetical protein